MLLFTATSVLADDDPEVFTPKQDDPGANTALTQEDKVLKENTSLTQEQKEPEENTDLTQKEEEPELYNLYTKDKKTGREYFIIS